MKLIDHEKEIEPIDIVAGHSIALGVPGFGRGRDT
jgi:hypothetical protein